MYQVIVKRKTSLFLIGIFVWHFLLHTGLSGYVLCIGDDGHIAVETSLDADACSDADWSHADEPAIEHTENCSSLDADHCGECRDIPLVSNCDDEQARQPQKTLNLQSIQLFASYDLVSNLHGSRSFSINTYSGSSFAPQLVLTSLQSVVLLI